MSPYTYLLILKDTTNCKSEKKFTVVRDCMVASDMGGQESLSWCEGQLGHDVKFNDAAMATLQVISFQQYPKSPYIVKDTTNYKSEKQTRNICSLKMQILQIFLVDGLDKYM